MAKKITDMSSDELYELARQREEQEAEAEKAAVREQIDALREQRRETVARHRKELAAIDADIKALGGRVARGKRRAGGVSVTEQVLDIVTQSGQISTRDIKQQLESRGVTANNLAQTLAYLKRQGRVTSPSRSVYEPA